MSRPLGPSATKKRRPSDPVLLRSPVAVSIYALAVGVVAVTVSRLIGWTVGTVSGRNADRFVMPIQIVSMVALSVAAGYSSNRLVGVRRRRRR